MGGLELQKQFQISSPSSLNIIAISPGETKDEDEEFKLGPIVVIPPTEEYPDGGLAAWCVVLGVRPSIFPCFLGLADGVWYVGYLRNPRDVSCTHNHRIE